MKPSRTAGGDRAAHDSHHAEQRRKRREEAVRARGGAAAPGAVAPLPEGRVLLYGLHTVRQALANPARTRHRLLATKNALARLEADAAMLAGLPVEEAEPRTLDRLLGADAVHQGVALEAEALAPRRLSQLGADDLVLVLDQVTDPHNVGAIMRSAVAFGAGALITTARHSPAESGVLAKAASGALDLIDHIEVRNLAQALEELRSLGYHAAGLDSEGGDILENSLSGQRIALVLGAEGKGLRQKTRETCAVLARIALPGPIRSLNVSNAAALALYISRRHLGTTAG